MTIERIIEAIKQKNPEVDLGLVKSAYDFANNAHAGQRRKSGEEYIQHPLETAYRLALMNLDTTTIAAGLLHDVPEETNHSAAEIKKEFGEEVADLVAGITKLGTIKYRGLARYAENLRKMFMAMAKDVRVVFIKFADRLHNLKTLYALAPVKQKRIALETLEIYAPIANRLGMGELKGELEDLSFPIVYPDEYEWVKKISRKKYEEQKKYAEKIIKSLEKYLTDTTINLVAVKGRAKHYYSLYKKLLRRDMDIDQVYDLVAVRIIVKGIDDCYQTLGYIHQKWPPLKGRIKDYIAQPKPNGYKSLHTTVFCEDGRIVEFQIRTEKMHEEAEWGIAAHWQFKESNSYHKKIVIPPEQIKWIQELLDEQENVTTPKRYLASLKLDFFKDRIFVFTPKGDVIDLPENATPVDFAYHIHTEVGHRCAGVRINEKQATLATHLRSGDMVEIIVDKKRAGPSEAWLDSVQTHLAKNKIKEYFNRERRSKLFNLLNINKWTKK